MTKPTQDKETLREAVELSTRTAFVASLMNANNEMGYLDFDSMEEMINRAWNYFVQGGPDAAIATMFERLRTPITDALKFAYCQGARDVSYELTGDTETTEDDFGEAGDDYAAIAASELLTAFQQENSDER